MNRECRCGIDRARQELEVGVVGQRELLRLSGEVRVHLVDLGCRLRRDLRHGAGTGGDGDLEPVALEHAA
jgi:hypothetical protein